MANTGNIIVTERDINPNSPTYNQTRTRTYQDLEDCPITGMFKLYYTTTNGDGQIDCDGDSTLHKTETQNILSDMVTAEIGRCVTRIEYETFKFEYNETSKLVSVSIPNTVVHIGVNAFGYCRNLTSVIIPNSVREIWTMAFNGCSGLTSVSIGNSVTEIADQVFSGCTSLNNVVIPNSVTDFGEWVFADCTSLTNVTLPNGISAIPNRTFYNCTGLTTFNITNNITSIGELAFYNCTGLTSVTIPNSVTSIGYQTFCECSGLSSVIIPDSVTSINDGAFWGCTSLNSITVNATTPPTLLGNYVFRDTNDCPIYVPSSSVNAYKTANKWSTYASRIQAIPS